MPIERRDTRRVLPRGRHAAPRQVVRRSQRERLLQAMAVAVSEHGYANAAVADVVAHAGVSRKTFYEHFANKEDCFLAAYDAHVDLLLSAIDGAVAAAAHPYEAAEAGTRAYVEFLSANGAFARAFFFEVMAVGPPALRRRARVIERFADQLEAIYDDARRALDLLPEPPPRHVFRACVGAANEMVTHELVRRGPERLPELADAILDVELRLLIGQELAERVRDLAP